MGNKDKPKRAQPAASLAEIEVKVQHLIGCECSWAAGGANCHGDDGSLCYGPCCTGQREQLLKQRCSMECGPNCESHHCERAHCPFFCPGCAGSLCRPPPQNSPPSPPPSPAPPPPPPAPYPPEPSPPPPAPCPPPSPASPPAPHVSHFIHSHPDSSSADPLAPLRRPPPPRPPPRPRPRSPQPPPPPPAPMPTPLADSLGAAPPETRAGTGTEAKHPTPNEQAALGLLLACILACGYALRRSPQTARRAKRARSKGGPTARFQRVACQDDLVEL